MAELGNSPEQCLRKIPKTEELEKLKKMSNWKASRPDQVKVFLITHLSVLHDGVYRQLQDLINHAEVIPKWLTTD